MANLVEWPASEAAPNNHVEEPANGGHVSFNGFALGLVHKGSSMAPNLDRDTARALVDAGYMPLHRYLELFGNDEPCRKESDGALRQESRFARGERHNRQDHDHRHKARTHKAA